MLASSDGATLPTTNAAGTRALCCVVMVPTSRGVVDALAAMLMTTIRLVGDSTVVETTLIPVPPKTTRVPPLPTNFVFGEPVMRTDTDDAPGAADAMFGSDSDRISSDFPCDTSPVALFVTFSAAEPTLSPAGTMTVMRRFPDGSG